MLKNNEACLPFSAGILSAGQQGCHCLALSASAHRKASSVCAVRLLCLVGSVGFKGLQWVTSEMDFVQGFSLNLNYHLHSQKLGFEIILGGYMYVW